MSSIAIPAMCSPVFLIIAFEAIKGASVLVPRRMLILIIALG